MSLDSLNRVLIVGGGPAGMTAAIALAQRGVRSEIVEREVDWRPAGIGIGLKSPPMRALRKLDLLSQLQERSWHHAVIDMMRPDGVKVAESYDLVIGADGVHSRMRPTLLPDAPEPAYAGQVIWRLDVRKPDELKRYTMMLGREIRLGLVPIAPGRAYVWMLDSSAGPERPPRAPTGFRDRVLLLCRFPTARTASVPGATTRRVRSGLADQAARPGSAWRAAGDRTGQSGW